MTNRPKEINHIPSAASRNPIPTGAREDHADARSSARRAGSQRIASVGGSDKPRPKTASETKPLAIGVSRAAHRRRAEDRNEQRGGARRNVEAELPQREKTAAQDVYAADVRITSGGASQDDAELVRMDGERTVRTFAFHSARVVEPTAVFARDEIVGSIRFLPSTKEWLAEANGHCRYCPSHAVALRFIETVAGADVQAAPTA